MKVLERSLFAFPRSTGDGGGGGGGGQQGGGQGGDQGGGQQGGQQGGGQQGGQGGGGQQGGADPWYAAHKFEQPVVDFINGKGFSDITTFAKSAMESDKLARSRNVIEKPDPKKVLEWDGFTELGWKPDRKDYQLEKPKLQQGQDFDEVEFGKFGDIAHKFKLSPQQAQGLYHEMHAYNMEQMAGLESARTGEVKALNDKLNEEWGAEAPKNRELAKRTLQHFGKFLPLEKIEAALGGPELVKVLYNIGAAMGEDSLVDAGGGGGGDMSPAQARAELQKLEGDPEFVKVLSNPRDPRNQEYASRRLKLIEIESRQRAA